MTEPEELLRTRALLVVWADRLGLHDAEADAYELATRLRDYYAEREADYPVPEVPRWARGGSAYPTKVRP